MSHLKVAVVGGGSWATAIVKLLTINVDKVYWYVRWEKTKFEIQKKGFNPDYLSSAKLDTDKLEISSDINYVFQNAECIVIAIPSVFVFSELNKLNIDLKDKYIYSAVKGIVPETNMILSDFICEKLGLSMDRIGAIVGPCHAEEVAMGKLSYLTIASENENTSEILAEMLKSQNMRVSTIKDVRGTEFAAVLKNIYAICAGIADALGYGDNFQAVLTSNSIEELNNILNVVSPFDRNIMANEYLGDMFVTMYSKFSRNRRFGNMIGEGKSYDEILNEMKMIAEGFYSVKSVKKVLSEFEVETPIIDAVFDSIFSKDRNPKEIFMSLSEKVG